MTRLQTLGWILSAAIGAALGVLLSAHDRPVVGVYEPRVLPTLAAEDPEVGWTTTTERDGW